MGSRALDVDEFGSSSDSRAPRPDDAFHAMATLPSWFQRSEHKRVLADNEVALYLNLHIALQRTQRLLEQGGKTVAAVNSIASSADEPVTSDSFSRVRSYMSGSVPESFPSALNRAWPAKEGYGDHPQWWTNHFPKRRKYPLPQRLLAALNGAEPGTAGLLAALQQYYASAASGIQAEQHKRLVQAKRSLDQAEEMVRFRDPEIRDRVEGIRSANVQLLDWTVARIASHEFEIAVRVATDYLPHTLQSYLDVPIEQMPIRAGEGKSAKDLTLEQLDIIREALDSASSNHATNEASKLLANQRFLESRFGGSSLDLPK